MKKFLKWIENYWYHYKWHTLIAAFFIVIGAVCLGQMLSRESYDAYLMYAGGSYFTVNEEQAVLKAFSNIAEDYDGNGKCSLCLTKLIVLSEEQLEQARAQAKTEDSALAYNFQDRRETLEQFDFEIMSGKSYLCLLSEDMYKRCKGKDRFVPVAELADVAAESLYDDYTIRLSETEFGQYFSEALSVLGDDVLVCLRHISATDGQNRHAAAEYKNYQELFRSLVQFSVK